MLVSMYGWTIQSRFVGARRIGELFLTRIYDRVQNVVCQLMIRLLPSLSRRSPSTSNCKLSAAAHPIDLRCFFPFRLSTYLVVAAIIGGLGYFTYLTYIPQPKKSRSKQQVVAASSPVDSAATSGTSYQEEWIPEHHFKKTKKAALTSGDEYSGSEGESKRRKGRKRQS